MSPACADLERFLDGELSPQGAAGFQCHLATCDRCQRVLRGRMQEEVITDAPDRGVVQLVAPAAARSRGRRRTFYLAALSAAAAAAAMAIVLIGRPPRGPEQPIELSLAIERSGAATRSAAAHVGDVLRPVVRGQGHRALWVYFGDREVQTACPGGAGCRPAERELALELPLTAPGSYTIIAIVSAAPIPPPQGVVDVMLSEVTRAGAQIRITHVEVN